MLFVRSPSPLQKKRRKRLGGQGTPVFIISFSRTSRPAGPPGRPRLSDIFMRLGVVLRPSPLARVFMNPHNGRDAVCCNLLRREMRVARPCVFTLAVSRPRAAPSAFFTRYIPPLVVAARGWWSGSRLCSNFDAHLVFSKLMASTILTHYLVYFFRSMLWLLDEIFIFQQKKLIIHYC